MGNCFSCAPSPHLFNKLDVHPIDQIFNLPSPLPSWPQGGGFASGRINLGGLEVCQITTFSKVWATEDGGQDNLGATFFDPYPLPPGFSMLGCYAQPNYTSQFGWVLVGKDDNKDPSRGALKMPVDFTLVWSSESMKTKQNSNGYVWLPIPPEGYQAVGLIVTNSQTKPPLEKTRCVRSDLTDSCEHDTLIWDVNDANGINVYGLRPVVRGTEALGVSVGTFTAELTGIDASPSLSCLKNVGSDLSCMPNLSQIEALVQCYSPRVYLHPEESYHPSSVNWFFKNGALLYKKGDESHPVSIDPNGSNLPQGGSNDGEYWLDLPLKDVDKDKVKKGDLKTSKAYIHVKPMLGATFTDLVIWVFYPFNGASTAKVQLIDIPLGKMGEHVGDWEHVTLRISNFTGELWKVYFSQHSGGSWVDASEVEFQGGNKVVSYSSLNGHAFYPKAGLVLQGDTKLGIGIRNDTAKSETFMDIGMGFVVVSAQYLGSTIVEPPWLNYFREWGPKISYDIGKELKLIEHLLPPKLRTDFERVINAIPHEVFGEEGPTGPKMKKNWTGDEA